jgi:hypothetical protein
MVVLLGSKRRFLAVRDPRRFQHHEMEVNKFLEKKPQILHFPRIGESLPKHRG